MTEIEIGRNKRAKRAYAFDDVAIVPTRRTRDPKDVSTAWSIDAYEFKMPILAAHMIFNCLGHSINSSAA